MGLNFKPSVQQTQNNSSGSKTELCPDTEGVMWEATLLLGWSSRPPQVPSDSGIYRSISGRPGWVLSASPPHFIFIKAPRELRFSYAQPARDRRGRGRGSNQ